MFYEQLKKICLVKNTTMTTVLKKLGINTGNIGSWKHGGNPSIEVLIAIADYLEVTTDQLLFDKKEHLADLEMNQAKIEVLDFFECLSKDKQDLILDYIKYTAQNNKKVK